jgi:hypothetical protein
MHMFNNYHSIAVFNSPVNAMTKTKFRITRSAFFIIILSVSLSSLYCLQPYAIKNHGIFGESRKNSIIGQDGCTSIPAGDSMLWTFGDTILGKWKGNLSVSSTFEDAAVMKDMISNSLAFTTIPDDVTIKNLNFIFYKEKGAVAQFIKPIPPEDPKIWRFWATDGIQIGKTVYVYYIIVYIDKNPSKKNKSFMPIRVLGVGIAEWRKPDAWKPGEPVSFIRTAKLFNEGEPVFGDSVIQRGDYLYLIGHGPAFENRVPAYIARVPVASIKKRSAYEYYDGMGGWSRNIKSANPFITDVMGELSLSYNEFLKQYVIIYCSLDGKIKSIVFPDFPELKNRKAAVIYVPPPLPEIKSRPNLFYYSGKQVFQTSRAIYAIYINPAIYQPILLEIPYRALTVIDPQK